MVGPKGFHIAMYVAWSVVIFDRSEMRISANCVGSPYEFFFMVVLNWWFWMFSSQDGESLCVFLVLSSHAYIFNSFPSSFFIYTYLPLADGQWVVFSFTIMHIRNVKITDYQLPLNVILPHWAISFFFWCFQKSLNFLPPVIPRTTQFYYKIKGDLPKK